MTTITDFTQKVQRLLTQTADELGRKTGLIRRQRKLTAAAFVQGLVFGQLAHSKATRAQLHQKVVYAGSHLTCQGLDQRFTPQSEAFLQAMLAQALCQEALGEPMVESLLAHFNGVWLVDSTVSKQGYKIMTRLNLSQGNIQVEIVPPTVHDNRVALAHKPLPAGALRLADLGFFDLQAFAEDQARGVFWLSRFKSGTMLFSAETGKVLDLVTLAKQHQEGGYIPVLVGAKRKLPAFLVIRPVDDLTAANRSQRRAARAKRKQRVLSPKTLQLAQWDVYLTNIPNLNVDAICALARARWQIERVFKLWKSFFGLELVQSSDPVRQSCLFYAKLLALWLVHVLMTLDANANRSWWQAADTLRDHAVSLLYALADPDAWLRLLKQLHALLPLTSRLSKRKSHPLLHQLLTLCT
jgi:hypothetical protein